MAFMSLSHSRFFRLLVATFALSASVLALSYSPVSADVYGVSYYIAPPLVQNSYVTTGALLENFDSSASGSCNGVRAVGTISGTCSFSNTFAYGGATTQSSNPTAGGTSSNYATGGSGSPTMTFTLNGPQRYLGFWWSAGSDQNTVKFFSGTDEVLTLTTADLMTLLGSAPSGSFGNTGSVTAVNGSTYVKHRYFGHPRGHTQVAPTSASTVTSNEPFTYLHVFTSGGLTFDKVTLSGGGFEFDNFVVSNVAQTPAQNLVRVNSIAGILPATAKVVTYNSNTGTGLMDNQVASASESLSLNSFSKAGHNFLGWSTSQTGSVNDYDDGVTYDFSADITLYARWSPISYNVTYDEQSGSAVNDNTYTIGSTVTLPAAPSRDGYTFDGWFASSTGGTALGATYAPSGTGDITLYAQWTKVAVAATPSVATTTTPTTTVAPTTTSIAPTTTTVAPSLEAPRTALAGESISVVARGFKPGEKVVLKIGDGKTVALVANDQGEVRLNFVLDSASRGNKKVVASAVGSGKSVTSEIQVTAPLDLPLTGSSQTPFAIFGLFWILLGTILVGKRRLFPN